MSPVRRSIVAALAAGALLLPGCGDDAPEDRQPARSYARTTCMGIGGWLEGIFDRNAELQRDLPPVEDPELAKEMLVDYFGDLVGITGDLRTTLEGTAPPDVEGGAEVHDRILSGVQGAEGVIEDALARAEDLPTDDLDALNAEAQAIGADVRDASDEIDASFEDLLTTDLAVAIAAEPACQDLSDIANPT